MIKRFAISALSLLCASTFSAHAFKVNTHVWIGQQVVNDLADNNGHLTFYLDGQAIEVPVNSDIANAILANKSDYLMGNIGPDAAPDVVVGQTLIHPGGENGGWETDDFMMHLLNNTNTDMGKAYSYGFLGHAASDVWAHSYVNQYVGDIFNYDNDALAAKRHVVLESFIAKYTPPLLDTNGQSRNPWDMINLDDDYGNFIRDTLVYDDTLENQYQNYGVAGHLAAYYEFSKGVGALAENGIWADIDNAVIQAVGAYFDIPLTSDEADQIRNAANQILTVVAGDIPDNLQTIDNQLFEFAVKYEGLHFQQVQNLANQLQTIESQVLAQKQQLESEILAFDSRLRNQACGILGDSLDHLANSLEFADQLIDPLGVLDPLNVHQSVINTLRNGGLIDILIDPLGLFGSSGSRIHEFTTVIQGNAGELYDQYTDEINNLRSYQSSGHDAEWYRYEHLISVAQKTRGLIGSYPRSEYIDLTLKRYSGSLNASKSTDNRNNFEYVCNDLNKVLDYASNTHIRAIHTLENTILNKKSELIQTTAALRDELIRAAQATQTIKNAAIDLVQVVGTNTSPIQGLLRNWKTDIDSAMTAYTKAASQSIVNTMNPNADALEPMQTWFSCYHLQIIGLPSQVSGCAPRQAVADLIDSIEQVILFIDQVGSLNSALGLPSTRDLIELRDQLIDDLKDALIDEVGAQLADVILPQPVQDVITLFGEPVDDATLNSMFTRPEINTPKGYLMIGDLADRVKAEMHLSGGAFDPTQFAPIRNAITMAKLALLDQNGFAYLAQRAGSSDYLNFSIQNLIGQSIANIDGDHQWMPTPPPLPRDGSSTQYPPVTYSYASNRPFVLWQNDMRDTIFRRLFIGPLSAGIDAPEIIGKTEIIPNNYPYDVCEQNPYPNDINDATCYQYADSDGDGYPNNEDEFDNDPTEWADFDQDGIGDNSDTDDDNDGVADNIDAFPRNPAESLDTDGDGIGNNTDSDDDNDGIADSADAFPLDATESVDTDNDGIGNNADTDDDNDGVADSADAFPLNSVESLDTDGDGVGNNADTDDDNDGVADSADAFPLNAAESVDTDGDGVGNNADSDDDNDGVADSADAFPLNAAESVDTDGDGVGNNADTDDDNDGVADSADAFPLNSAESVDTDSDGVGNNADTDDDNDGVADSADAFPLNSAESVDTDSDGVGNNADTDDDNDGVADSADAFPLNSAESVDTDGDGIGNNADTDDDNDGVADSADAFPLNSAESLDTDGDGVGNNADTDDDNDGVADSADAFPLNAAESVDTDGDGVGNNADTDDDNDGVADSADAFPLSSAESVDTDGDGVGNNADTDDDNDGVADSADAFPLNSAESVDTDGDGIGNNADNDDDNDGVLDSTDLFPLNAAEFMDSDGDGIGDNGDNDDDNDGTMDIFDAFPYDSTEWLDSDGDGHGNNSDAFPYYASEWLDSDNDGWGDNTDDFPTDPTEWQDTDGDGHGNNSDAFMLDAAEWQDTDADGYGDNGDAFPLDPTEWLDSDRDGYGDNRDVFPFEYTEWQDTDSDGHGDNGDAFPTNPAEWLDSDFDGIGNNADEDDDNDSIPDYFEIARGFDPVFDDSEYDNDGNGVTNIDEYNGYIAALLISITSLMH